MTTPLGFLYTEGARADPVTPLLWFVLIVSLLVVTVVAALLVAGARRDAASTVSSHAVPVRREQGGLRPIVIGLIVSLALLLASLGWTLVALGQVLTPPRRLRIEIDVTAHQWWWQADYAATAAAQAFTTANELHIPVGEPVLVRLHGGDVIHSFWVPRLSGKTDAIPGQVNQTWLQADHPGRYAGQCSEYCGAQHAHMGFIVVADTPAQYAQWRRAQLQTAPPPATPAQVHGLALFQNRCALCHAARGTLAGSRYGPDLSHLFSRKTIAAGTLPLTRGSLAGWIEDPQAAKPEARMPPQQFSGEDLQDLLTYLEMLR